MDVVRDDVKQGFREVEDGAKEVGRAIDGHQPSDDIGNAGDDARRALGNAGDDVRRGLDKAGDALRDGADQTTDAVRESLERLRGGADDAEREVERT